MKDLLESHTRKLNIYGRMLVGEAVAETGSVDLYRVLNYIFERGHGPMSAQEIYEINNHIKRVMWKKDPES